MTGMTGVFIAVFGVCAWFGLIFVALAIASMGKSSQPRLSAPSNVSRIKNETL